MAHTCCSVLPEPFLECPQETTLIESQSHGLCSSNPTPQFQEGGLPGHRSQGDTCILITWPVFFDFGTSRHRAAVDPEQLGVGHLHPDGVQAQRPHRRAVSP